MSDSGDGVQFDADTIQATSAGAAPVDPDSGTAIAGGFDRYEAGDLLGAGGMGEVRRYRDAAIGREVAIKIAREPAGDAGDEVRRRFEREARIQGQLEHPGVVPVYDLGTREDGTLFFAMKRVRGETLEAIIAGLRAGVPEVVEAYPRHRLLRAFASACQAVAYANSRGVVHRDLKPANIILGDFGEVYVLDWGVAKVFGDVETSPAVHGSTGPEDQTRAGSLLGTPGYMAPEQIRATGAVDARTDVYALGLILFELLTLERFIRAKTVEEALGKVLEGEPARPRQRAPERDIPPELDALCARATAAEPDDRPADARDIAGELERYLAGERDAEKRRALADAHVEVARRALADGRDDPERDVESQARAMRELIAAFALDPQNRDARHELVGLLAESAGQLPNAARDELEEMRSHQRRRAARNATIGMLSLFGLIPLLFWTGVKSGVAVAAMIGALVVSTGVAFAIARARRIPPSYYIGMMVVLGVFIATTATLFGPYFVTPALALGICASLIAGSRMAMGWRALVIAIGVAATLIPAIIDQLAATSAYAVSADGALQVIPAALRFSSGAIVPILAIMAVAAIVVPSMLVGRSVDVLHRAEEQQFAQAWRLRQILPEEGR